MGILRDFLEGVQTGRSREVLPEIPPRGTPDDFSDYRPDDMQDERQPGTEPVRTLHGVLDFLTEVVDDMSTLLDQEAGEGHRDRPRKRVNPILKTYPVAATDFSIRRVNVGTGMQVAARREHRRSVRLVNWGTDWVFVSQVPIADWDATGAPPPNVLIIPPSNLAATPPEYFPIVIETTDQLWARNAPGGVASVVEVLETYGVPE